VLYFLLVIVINLQKLSLQTIHSTHGFFQYLLIWQYFISSAKIKVLQTNYLKNRHSLGFSPKEFINKQTKDRRIQKKKYYRIKKTQPEYLAFGYGPVKEAHCPGRTEL